MTVEITFDLFAKNFGQICVMKLCQQELIIILGNVVTTTTIDDKTNEVVIDFNKN